MQSTTRDVPASEGVDPGSAGTGTIQSSVLAGPVNWFEKYLLVLVIGGLVAGIWVASVSQTLVDYVDSTVNLFMDGYVYVAPIAIFLILTPSLARLFGTPHMGWFGLFVIGWFAGRKILAGLWAVAFVFLGFRIPFLPQGSLSLADGIIQTLGSLGNMMLTSSYFWAMYAAVAVSFVSTRIERLTRLLEKIMDGVELGGSYLMPVMPVFMFAIGAYIYGLPDNVQEQVGLGEGGQECPSRPEHLGLGDESPDLYRDDHDLRAGSGADWRRLHDLAVRLSCHRSGPGTQVFHHRLLQELLDQGLPAALGHKLRGAGHSPEPGTWPRGMPRGSPARYGDSRLAWAATWTSMGRSSTCSSWAPSFC